MAEGTTDAAVFLKDISHPPAFGDPQDCARNRLCTYALGPHQFALGAAGTGSPMHTHQDAWNALIYGRKRWFIAPPARANYSYTHIRAWMEADYPQLPPSQRPLECVQRAGEVMYVPGKRSQLGSRLSVLMINGANKRSADRAVWACDTQPRGLDRDRRGVPARLPADPLHDGGVVQPARQGGGVGQRDAVCGLACDGSVL